MNCVAIKVGEVLKKQYLSPKNDQIFKRIFNNEKEGYLKEFLKLLFKEEMQDFDVMLHTVLEKEHKNNKYCILDVAAKSENTFIALEMQNKIGKDFENRVDMYDRKTGSYLAKAGGDYNNLQFKQKMVWLLGQKLDNEDVCIDNICRVYNKRGRKIRTNSEIYVIELPKIQEGEKHFEDKLWQWLYFLGT